METKDYYLVFGVNRNVGTDGLKSAYRRLARKYHPDVSEDADAENKFKEVQEAYATLKSPERRCAYDQRVWADQERRRSNPSPINYGAFCGELPWMESWNSWWAWQGLWARGMSSAAEN